LARWLRSGDIAMKTCLVVDDSRVIRKVARRILEALAWCRSAMPDAILLDWNMPVMTGIEFLRRLREEPEGETPVVVFCTVENDLAHIREALEAGANEYIMKPFDGDIISAKFVEAGL
jgi:two-component system chemotaxis response regulator CheY